mmetsp:Transcript_41193/g.89769  ORF Transcript_41193/g.89769 Transcript_41193/m.89769 type:complete len:276 (-) Transcript_41193:722-1549(-)
MDSRSAWVQSISCSSWSALLGTMSSMALEPAVAVATGAGPRPSPPKSSHSAPFALDCSMVFLAHCTHGAPSRNVAIWPAGWPNTSQCGRASGGEAHLNDRSNFGGATTKSPCWSRTLLCPPVPAWISNSPLYAIKISGALCKCKAFQLALGTSLTVRLNPKSLRLWGRLSSRTLPTMRPRMSRVVRWWQGRATLSSRAPVWAGISSTETTSLCTIRGWLMCPAAVSSLPKASTASSGFSTINQWPPGTSAWQASWWLSSAALVPWCIAPDSAPQR